MSSLFIVGTLNHQNHLNQKEGKSLSKVLVIPQKVCFYSYDLEKVNIAKVNIKNDASNKIMFKIIQPKNSVLQVKYKKNNLNPKQSMEIFVFFNAQKQKVAIDDEFVLQFQKQRAKIHIPIICKYSNFRLSHTTNILHHKRILNSIQNNSQGISSKNKFTIAKKRKYSMINAVTTIGKMIDTFMEKFAHIHDFIKEKNVKKQIFIGEKALTWENQSKIIQFNYNIRKIVSQKLKNVLQTRYHAQYAEQGPVIQNLEGMMIRWDESRNTPKIVYNKGVAKIQQQIRKYIVNLRFDKIHKIFSIYRQFQNEQENSHLPLHKKHEFYVQKLQKKLHKSSEQSLQLHFDKSSVKLRFLDMQYDNQFLKVGHSFQINPRIGFDNWVAIQQSIPYNHQNMGYTKKQGLPDWCCYPKIGDIFSKKQKQLQALRQDVDDYQLRYYLKNLQTKVYQKKLCVSLQRQINQKNYSKFRNFQQASDNINQQKEDPQNYLKTERYALDSLNRMTIFRQDFQPYQNSDNIYLAQELLDYEFDIKHGPQKQDKNQYSQNDTKIKNILNLIEFNNKRNDFKNGKIKGVDFDAALKNKMRNNTNLQTVLQNLQKLKKNQLIVSHSKSKNWQTFVEGDHKKFQLHF